ncbi:MAG: radical SAM [archaeon]|nr:radical SAM [archaeon]
MPIDAKAAEILSRGWYKEPLEANDCEYLMTFRDKSSEANLATSLANRLVHRTCSEVGQITAEIEVSTGPCSGNCKFCRYSEGTTSLGFNEMEDSVLARCVEKIGGFSDVKNIRLTTCADTDLDDLCRRVGIVKDNARKGTRIFVNTCDMDVEDCRRIRKAGAYGAYHACRLREGTDTQIKKEARMKTISNLAESGLAVITGLGPIGPEHDMKEIIGSFYEILDLKANNLELEIREPVVGTPLYQYGKMNPSRVSQLRAVLTLASSWYDSPVKSTYGGTYLSGANSVVTKVTAENVMSQIEAARRKLFNSGFERLLKTDDSTVELNLMYLRQSGSV